MLFSGICLLGVMLRMVFMLGLAYGAIVAFVGFHSDDYLMLCGGVLLIWIITMLWTRLVEREDEERQTHPLYLE